MPRLTYEIPRSQWARLVERARLEGVSPRTLVLWELRESLARPEDGPSSAPPEPTDVQAAA